MSPLICLVSLSLSLSLTLFLFPTLLLAGGHSNHRTQCGPIEAHTTPERLAALASGTICTGYKTQADCEPITLMPQLPPCGDYEKAPQGAYMFAIVGDYGIDNNCEHQVAALLHQLERQFGTFEFVMTTGDNAYYEGACSVYKQVLGLYADYINTNVTCINPSTTSSMSTYGTSHQTDETLEDYNVRFWPTLGNHDWDHFKAHIDQLPYFQYFSHLRTLEPTQGKGQYYTKLITPEIQLFSVNSNIYSTHPTYQTQKSWLQSALRASEAPHKFVFFHHPPHTTAQHDPIATWMDWDFEGWGATAVFNGHQHVYERLQPGRIPYIVNGLGGNQAVYMIDGCDIYPGSQLRYNDYHGAMIGIVQPASNETGVILPQIDICFYSTQDQGMRIDHFQL